MNTMPQTVFVLADSALELIPQSIVYSDLIKKTAKKRGKSPHSMMLDSSYHYRAMTKIKDSNKRGRPDIVHFSLLNLLGAPLIKENPDEIRILIHTYNGTIIEINPETRIPKHYPRFIGLMEQLLTKGEIRNKDESLMWIIENLSLSELLKDIPENQRLLLTHSGESIELESYFKKKSNQNLCTIIGCFSHGNFSSEIEELTNNKISISNQHLEAWTVFARIVFLREISFLSRG